MERVEATEHVIEAKENYWTISRQYWGSGRYFAALWKANAANHPDINVLHVGDVIVVPAIEDLNPDYILPPGKTATPEWLASLGIQSRAIRGSRTGASGDEADAGSARATARARPASGQGSVPARRAIQSNSEDDSDLSVTASGGDRSTSYKGRSAAAAKVFDGDEAGDDQEVRTAQRPRSSAASGANRPIYRVRAYDTLRSIARDTLGSSRRAGEILELNRGVIDDPGQLVVGQTLELPEDARGGIRRSGGGR
jgi:nucleoid-associated protein YgaU